jgi:hypothetical protein
MTSEREEKAGKDGPRSPSHGRSGRGAASILPHLDRQQKINDKQPPDGGTGDGKPADGQDGNRGRPARPWPSRE